MKEIYLDALAEAITDTILLLVNVFISATFVINVCYVLNTLTWIMVPVAILLAFVMSFVYSLYTTSAMKWTTSDINSSLFKATVDTLLENVYMLTLPALYIVTQVMIALSTNVVDVVISIIVSVFIIPSVIFALVYMWLWAVKRTS